jgi:copper chaperone CopZ
MRTTFITKLIPRLVLAMVGIGLLTTSTYAQSSKLWAAEVLGLSCPLCANNIEKQLKRDKDVKEVTINLGTGQVIVHYKSEKPNMQSAIKKAIEDSGFTVRGVIPWDQSKQ